MLVWNKYIIKEKGYAFCMCCNTNKITQMNFYCRHIIAEVNE